MKALKTIENIVIYIHMVMSLLRNLMMNHTIENM